MKPIYLFHVYSVAEICSIFNVSERKARTLKRGLHKPIHKLKKLPRTNLVRDNLKFNLMYSTPKLLSPGNSIEFIAYSLNVSKSILPWYGCPHYQQYIRSRKWVLLHKIRAKPENILYLENLGIHLFDQNIVVYKNLQALKGGTLPLPVVKDILESHNIQETILTHSNLIKNNLSPILEMPTFIPQDRRLYVCDDTYDTIAEYIK